MCRKYISGNLDELKRQPFPQSNNSSMLCSIMNYPHCICKSAYYIIEICLLSLRSLVFLETVYSTKIYIKMPHWKISISLNDLCNVEWYMYYVEWFVLCWMICTTRLNGFYFPEWFELRWMIFNFLNDLQYVKRLALRW